MRHPAARVLTRTGIDDAPRHTAVVQQGSQGVIHVRQHLERPVTTGRRQRRRLHRKVLQQPHAYVWCGDVPVHKRVQVHGRHAAGVDGVLQQREVTRPSAQQHLRAHVDG